MDSTLLRVAQKIFPQLETMSEHRRLVGAGDVLTFLYSLPLAIMGLAWLAIETDSSILSQEWQILLLILGLIILFHQVSYFFIVEIRTDRYGSANGSLASMIHWSAILLFGPTALWLWLLWLVVDIGWNIRQSFSTAARWNNIRGLTVEITCSTLALLIPLAVYVSWGGNFPIQDLSGETIILAFAAIAIHFLLVILVWSGYIAYNLRVQKTISPDNSIRPILKFSLLSLGLPFLALPFGILAAGLYVENGLEIYLFFVVGMFLVAYLARRLSWVAESSRQQSRQLEKLEQLGRAIITAPPDASSFPPILEQHLLNMFPSGNLAIWIAPDQLFYKHPPDWPAPPDRTWEWLLDQSHPQAFSSKDKLPWEERSSAHNAIVVTPVLQAESERPIGGIYLQLRTLSQPWDIKSLRLLFPALQSLAALIASAFHRLDVYAQSLAYQNLTQELSLAGQIQASFLPNKFPTLPGWQVAVSLLPARETSGDYFDVMELSGGRLGILIADVADKGVGPALYMALSRTLIRTYAVEYDAEPEVVFFAANERLLKDARANLFVTAFYGILDPESGTLTYANAGHNPPFLIKSKENGSVSNLGRTGMAIGIDEDATWSQSTINIAPGDLLILYTDGIPDAQNDAGLFFEDDRLIEVAQENLGLPAHELQTCILERVQDFVNNAPQSDDITLMILIRDS